MQAAAWVSPTWHPCSPLAGGAAAGSRRDNSGQLHCHSPQTTRQQDVPRISIRRQSSQHHTHPQRLCGPATRPPCPRPGCPSQHPARGTSDGQNGHNRMACTSRWNMFGVAGMIRPLCGALVAPDSGLLLMECRQRGCRYVTLFALSYRVLTLPFIFLRSFLASERCHLGSQRSGSGGGPGLAGSKLQRLWDERQLQGC